MPTRNKIAGTNAEFKILNFLLQFYSHLARSATESVTADNNKIDIVRKSQDEEYNPLIPLPISPQVKSYARVIPYPEILSSIKGKNPIIFHQFTKNVSTKEKPIFREKGIYVIMDLQTFQNIMNQIPKNKLYDI